MHSCYVQANDKQDVEKIAAMNNVSDMKDMLYIAIRRGGKLIIPSGNVTFMPGDVITVFTKKESEGRSVEYMDELFH